MSAIWDFYWPAFVVAAILGVIAGTFHFRRARGPRDYRWLMQGAALACAIGLLWHSVGGAGNRFASSVDAKARQVLVDFEMTPVSASLDRDPVSRTIILSGPADDFQRRELARIMTAVPGVAAARWDRPIQKAKAD